MFYHSARACPKRTFLKSSNGAAGEQLRPCREEVTAELMESQTGFWVFFAVDAAGVPLPAVMRTR